MHGDRNLPCQVFYNLLATAVKYTRPRDVARIKIAALPAATPTQIVCADRDNGVGFDPRYTHKLFGVFQRLRAASAFEGTGIGLVNAQRIVQRHGGRVWPEGKVDVGATFSASLPAAQSTVSTMSTRSTRSGANAYVVKPVKFDEFIDAVSGVGVFWAGVNEPPPGCTRSAGLPRRGGQGGPAA